MGWDTRDNLRLRDINHRLIRINHNLDRIADELHTANILKMMKIDYDEKQFSDAEEFLKGRKKWRNKIENRTQMESE